MKIRQLLIVNKNSKSIHYNKENYKSIIHNKNNVRRLFLMIKDKSVIHNQES
jgi:hypothetical protein